MRRYCEPAFTLWQKDLDSLDEGESYDIKNLSVREFNGSKYLTPEKSGWSFNKCPDIGDVYAEDSVICHTTAREITDAQVVGVYESVIKFTCINCKANVNVLNGEKLGKCTKCALTQRLDRCSQSLSVKLVVSTVTGEKHTLYAFLPMIKCITKNEDICIEASGNLDFEGITSQLLMADKFNLTFTVNNIIDSVYRAD